MAIDGIYRVKVIAVKKSYQFVIRRRFVILKRWQNFYFILLQALKNKLRYSIPRKKAKAGFNSRIKDKLKQSKVSRWFSRKYEDARETLQAAKIVTKVGLKSQKKFLNDPEKTIIDFLNDILVLYLIRLHWDHITKEWIPKPLKYRNEWMAVFYMIFLLMRSRRPK